MSVRVASDAVMTTSIRFRIKLSFWKNQARNQTDFDVSMRRKLRGYDHFDISPYSANFTPWVLYHRREEIARCFFVFLWKIFVLSGREGYRVI